MKQYPSISFDIDRDLQIYAFDKLDGSNIRVEWSRKAGFYKYGSKNVLMDRNHPELGEAVDLIESTYRAGLEAVFRDERWDRVVCFFEFHGANSFAGQHAQEEHKVTLIDVNPFKLGMEPPRDFIRKFEHLGIPKVLYVGKANKEFEESVRAGTLDGMTFEGVVCKGLRKGRHLTMFKIKNRAWLQKLRDFCAGNDDLFRRLQ